MRKSGFSIMKRLIVELKPLASVMFITVFMGVLGFLVAIGITVFGSVAISSLIDSTISFSFKTALILMIVLGILRGPLRYGEQLSGHYIAFKILVILRDKVFLALRKLAPAKLEGMEKGNLISMITSDIELLEVFYAHTIAPISIAIITNTIMGLILLSINVKVGIVGIIGYILIGFWVPYISSSFGKEAGVQYREAFGKTNSYILDSLRGIKEVLIFNNGNERRENIKKFSEELNEKQKVIKKHEGIIRAFSDLIIMLTILIALYVAYLEVLKGTMTIGELIIVVTLIASSFGPVVALSNLSNNLLLTFASAQRIFNILDEKPSVEEVLGEGMKVGNNIEYKDVSFAYKGKENVLKDVNIDIKLGDKIAVIGESGTGKSTFVKLLMRFWDVTNGEISLGNKNVKEIETKELRKKMALMGQETSLFNMSIEDNIKIGKLDATLDEVKEAAKKAGIHEFIMGLEDGYKTKVGELGGNLSSGEKQRIGLARVFLRESEIVILDEPTSNLDTLNEGIILKSIRTYLKDKTLILITHRKSTTRVCEKVFRINKGNLIQCEEVKHELA
ncbi:ABC transporter ATP-binding protein [Clostridium perfringens]|nr:ABC transporter ATP-binding protein [Clostridium perfringens]MDM0467444.1 ABC transporter ATP-binding protein [Clostridium perfringens]